MVRPHSEFQYKFTPSNDLKDVFVRVLVDLSTWMTLLSMDCFTGQRVEIDVNYQPGERAGLSTGIMKIFYAAIVGLSTLTALILAMMYCKFDRVEQTFGSQPAIRPFTHMTAPATPEHRSSTPSVSNEQSPRTPQPFVDYVRRTIDETPYYRREARRRVNPQNTF